MNIFTQLATQFLINKNTLVQLLKNLRCSNEFISEFRNNHIYINEDIIRQKIRMLCLITEDESFQDLLCHDNGIQLVFHATPHEYRFMRFRISFDIKLITVVLNNEQQKLQFLISNIQIKSLNYISKPFQFCIQVMIEFGFQARYVDALSMLLSHFSYAICCVFFLLKLIYSKCAFVMERNSLMLIKMLIFCKNITDMCYFRKSTALFEYSLNKNLL